VTIVGVTLLVVMLTMGNADNIVLHKVLRSVNLPLPNNPIVDPLLVVVMTLPVLIILTLLVLLP
jgi:hypothetical protein